MDINISFCKLKLDDKEFSIPFRDDGYIYATGICQAAGKKISDWLRLNQTKIFINEIEKETNLTEKELIKIYKGGNYKDSQGTWIHRKLATHLAQWCSIKFSIQISNWIEEWINYKQKNEIKYLYHIYNIKPDDKNNLKEKEIQLKLQEELGGDIEVLTETGYIDLITDNEIIEIKTGKNWKEAVGQILMYSLDYPKHSKRIHLFDIKNDDNINTKCKVYNINVTYEKSF